MRNTRRGSDTLVLLTIFLALLLSACTDEEPLPPVLLPQSLPRSMKGYELYSWKSGRAWRFTLITGTNRLKTLAEISSPESIVEDDWIKITVEGVPDLKAALDRLPSGTQVFWSGARRLESGSATWQIDPRVPPQRLVKEVRSHCAELGIQLEVSR